VFQLIHHVSGRVLWANLHLLFWLSLTPFVTAWMGATHFASLPVAAYGLLQFLAGAAFYILVRVLAAAHPSNSTLADALGEDFKGKVSVGLYALSVPLSFFARPVALVIFVLVALMWVVPDSRAERALAERAR
jgi:uncharacterized membrane protein